jgi:hypothetical protein
MLLRAGERAIGMERQGVSRQVIADWMEGVGRGLDEHLSRLIELTEPSATEGTRH